ncbi:uncharacterized protein LOC128228251 [Mya arenaria]|uniref:uncharacterized protein LOC128228251 n=1 Tax=Mya arenaria TaxID=6604 RepID=UPI0022E96476|nr:uncharacterized protein LOC128228251 [Mya arenaria]
MAPRANHTITGGHTIGHSPIDDKLRRFNDSDSWNHGRISAIRMLCGQYLLALQVQYNGLWATKHGFWNPKCTENQSWTPTHYFGEDEWIDRAELTGGWYTSSITLTTNKRRLETCGIPVESPTFQESGRLEYVSGIFGCYFDRLQLHWSLARCPSGKLITGDINDCKSCPIGTCKNNSLEIFGAECTPCTDSTTQSIARNASQSSTLRANHTTTEGNRLKHM